MDFSTRISQQFRNPNGGSNNNGNNGRSRRKEDDSDAFMRLPDREIAGCISDIGVPFSPADLQKPNPQQIQLVFEWFAELLMNTTRETVEPAMRAAAEDICGEYMDIVPSDTRNLMGFYISLRKLLSECGIHDFSFSDLLKPTHERLVKIFSYIINFVRFRESQTATIDEHFNKSERTKARIETLYAENQDMQHHLDDLRRSRKSLESHVKDKSRRNEDLKQRLLELKKGQEKVVERLESVRAEKSHMTRALEDTTEHALTARHESEKLRPYVLQSPAALQAALADLADALGRDKAHIDALDRRTRALQTSTDAFAVVAADVAACTKLLADLAAELAREDDEALRAARHRDALAERGNNVREVERTEALLRRQLARWTERTEALRAGSRAKTAAATAQMEELRGVHRALTEERGGRGREMERRRVRIEQTEKKMVDLKENIEAEIGAAREEYLCMEAHVRLYVTEMEGAI